LLSNMRNELAEMLQRDRFVPFVVTMNDGFAIAIPNPEKALVACQHAGGVGRTRPGSSLAFPLDRPL